MNEHRAWPSSKTRAGSEVDVADSDLRWFKVTYVVEATDVVDAIECCRDDQPESVEELGDA